VLGIELNVMLEAPPAPTVEVAMDSNLPTEAKVNELDAADAAEEPVVLDAVTVNV
jgi:hypothetical protein